MKAYKVKSLIYLSCFVAAAVYYYNTEQQDNFKDQLASATVAETEFQDASELETEETKEKLVNQE
ncbi:hypothetical protein [uncultured Croceitalea sp.]|uniref:hypothetical protein n=1 Tax=uncultured Croceitalea sp. TaxID=1798908 RepID=UPI0033067626